MNKHSTIPFAVVSSSGEVRSALHVEKVDGPFVCLECNETLILKKGKIKVCHFAHRSNSACAGESIYHLLAKRIISTHLSQLMFMEVCKSCRAIMRHVDEMEHTFTRHHQAIEEFTLGSYKIDVAVLQADKVIAAIEVFHTHAVDQPKFNHLTNTGVPVIEVIATEVITAYTEGTFLLTYHVHKYCANCTNHQREVQIEKKRKEFTKEHKKCHKCEKWRPNVDIKTCAHPSEAFEYWQAYVCRFCINICCCCNTWDTNVTSTKITNFLCSKCIQAVNTTTQEEKEDNSPKITNYFKRRKVEARNDAEVIIVM